MAKKRRPIKIDDLPAEARAIINDAAEKIALAIIHAHVLRHCEFKGSELMIDVTRRVFKLVQQLTEPGNTELDEALKRIGRETVDRLLKSTKPAIWNQ